MFERYDEPARRVIFFARYEAGAFGAAEILGEFGLSIEMVREDHVKRAGGG